MPNKTTIYTILFMIFGLLTNFFDYINADRKLMRRFVDEPTKKLYDQQFWKLHLVEGACLLLSLIFLCLLLMSKVE